MRLIQFATFLLTVALTHSPSLAQTAQTGGVQIAVTNFVQNKGEVTISLDAINQSPRAYETLKAECAVFNKAGMMIGNKRAILMHDLPASATAHFDATVTVLSLIHI